MRSEKLSWAWLTAGRQVSNGPCEIVSVMLWPAAVADNFTLYNGHAANAADLIFTMGSVVVTSWTFCPPKPIYCDKGLFAVLATATTRVFVQWRELGLKRDEPVE